MLEHSPEKIDAVCKIHKITLVEGDHCPECLLGESSFSGGDPPEGEITPETVSPDSQPIAPDDESEKEVKPSEDSQPEEAEKKAPETGNSFGIENSKTDNLIAVQGKMRDIVIKYGSYNSKIPLFKESLPLSLEDCGELDDSLSHLLASFEKERLLLLGDAGDERGFTVSCQIANSLKIENKEENIRLFYLYNHETENPLSINSFDLKRERSNSSADTPEALIIIEATGARKEFADSLLKSGVSFAKHHLRPLLRQNRLYLICVVESEHIGDWKGNLDKRNFPYQNFDNRKEKDCKKERDVGQQAENLLRLENDVDGPITKTVLFVASFFPSLKTDDFNDLVRKWLMNEPDITRPQTVQNDSEEIVSTKISLRQVWDLKSHAFTEQCFLSQKKDALGKKIITFEDESYLEYFKERLESKHFFFLSKKISDILDFGLVFDSSPDISNQSIAVLVEFIRQIEDKLHDWLLEVFRILETVENLDELGRHLKVEEHIGKHFYYDRLAKLFRALLPDSSLKTSVDRLLDRLIHNKFYKSVLILVKRLYYAPNFDGMRWLKELLERGDALTRNDTLGYLFVNLININTADVFESLKIWLPDDETPVINYSRANKAALSLLVDYYSYQTYIFDEQFYGLEPCQFPLFVFEDKSSADSQLNLIVKYLLYPANFILLSDELPYIYHVAYLLERWTAILFRDPAFPKITHDTPQLSGGELLVEDEILSNKEITGGLLELVILHSDKDKQEELIFIWERFLGELGVVIGDLGVDWRARKNASNRRKIVRNLIDSFKKHKRTKR